jgi:hypothetical protein
MYEFGIKTATAELKVKNEGFNSMRDLQLLDVRASEIARHHRNEILHQALVIALGNLNRTVEDIVNLFQDWANKFKEGMLKTAIQTESITAINLGRSRVAKAFVG